MSRQKKTEAPQLLMCFLLTNLKEKLSEPLRSPSVTARCFYHQALFPPFSTHDVIEVLAGGFDPAHEELMGIPDPYKESQLPAGDTMSTIHLLHVVRNIEGGEPQGTAGSCLGRVRVEVRKRFFIRG